MGEAAEEAPRSIGAYLARQRSLRGISLEELARRTRIPLRSLERLEAGAFDAVPDGFARGFVRTVASAIGLDPDETVARMLPEANGPSGRRRSDLRGILFAGVGLAAAGLAASAAWLWLVSRTAAGDEPAPPPGLQVRRDAVRALAVERGLIESAGADPLAPPGTGPESPVAPRDEPPAAAAGGSGPGRADPPGRGRGSE